MVSPARASSSAFVSSGRSARPAADPLPRVVGQDGRAGNGDDPSGAATGLHRVVCVAEMVWNERVYPGHGEEPHADYLREPGVMSNADWQFTGLSWTGEWPESFWRAFETRWICWAARCGLTCSAKRAISSSRLDRGQMQDAA
jgi:hypothetical protein